MYLFSFLTIGWPQTMILLCPPDGAPTTAKRARQANRHARARSKPYAPQASGSERAESPTPQDDTGYNSGAGDKKFLMFALKLDDNFGRYP